MPPSAAAEWPGAPPSNLTAGPAAGGSAPLAANQKIHAITCFSSTLKQVVTMSAH